MGVYLHEKVPFIIISIQPYYTKYLSLRSMETYASSSTSYLFYKVDGSKWGCPKTVGLSDNTMGWCNKVSLGGLTGAATKFS